MTERDIPQERDLPAGRLAKLKDDLMNQIAHDVEKDAGPERLERVAVAPRRWRRIGLVAAALATGFGLAATSLMPGGHDPAGANTAVRTEDGAILITIREGKEPKELERRLNDLGVAAVVDFVPWGHSCDRARSTGWVLEPRGEELFTWSGNEHELVLRPEHLRTGEIAVFEFQVDDGPGDDLRANAKLTLSRSPVGPCVPVPDAVPPPPGAAGG